MFCDIINCEKSARDVVVNGEGELLNLIHGTVVEIYGDVYSYKLNKYFFDFLYKIESDEAVQDMIDIRIDHIGARQTVGPACSPVCIKCDINELKKVIIDEHERHRQLYQKVAEIVEIGGKDKAKENIERLHAVLDGIKHFAGK